MNETCDKPTIAFCINELDVGGAEKALVRIAVGLARRDWDVHVVSLRDAGPLTRPLAEQGVPVTALGGGGFGDVRVWWRLRKQFQRIRPQAVVSFLHQANIASRLALCGTGIPLVSGIRVADRRWWVIASDRLTSCCTDKYVAVSPQVAQTHAELCRLSPQQIMAIPNGVDLPEAGSVPPRGAGQLLFVGRLTPQKAPFDLLEAFALLPDDLRKSTRLTFAGDGELRSALEAAVQQRQLGAQVQCVGHVDDVTGRMQTATALILPSHWEGMPNVVLEAMAQGLPVVATAVDGTQELITAGSTGWLVEPGHPAALATAIADCLRHEDLRQKYANAAQNLAKTRFSWESVVDRYEQLLISLQPTAGRPADGEM